MTGMELIGKNPRSPEPYNIQCQNIPAVGDAIEENFKQRVSPVPYMWEDITQT